MESHTNPYCSISQEIQKEPCRKYSTPLYTSKGAMLTVYIAALVSERHSSTKQMLDGGSEPTNLTSFSQVVPSSHKHCLYIHMGSQQ